MHGGTEAACLLLGCVRPSPARSRVSPLQAVAGNILALLEKRGLKAYKPHGKVMFLPLGPTDGLGQAPFGVVGPGLVSSAKGKNLFVNKYWKALHAPAPAVPRL